MSRDRASCKILIDNSRVRVAEWTFAPGEATGWHKHAHDYIVVPMTTGTLELEEAGGVRAAGLVQGEPYFRPAAVEHDVINANAYPFRFIEIELK